MAAISFRSPPASIAAGTPVVPRFSVSVSRPLAFFPSARRHVAPRLTVASRLYSSKPSSSSSSSGGEAKSSSSSGGDGSLEDQPSFSSSSSSSGDGGELLYVLAPLPRSGKVAPVFVTLPADAVGPTGQVTRRKVIGVSLMALASGGVEGVVMECWWGIVERDVPGVYDWRGYLDLAAMARRYGLKVRAIMAFHQWGTGPGDPGWIPLPQWVLEEIEKEPDLAYTDRFGERNKEYISLGCDFLPVLRGRSPIQAYSDFMRSFRDNFREFLGVVVTEIQVGMGPAGELRYPSFPTKKLKQANSAPELGKFQYYDKYMLASLNACARKVGMTEWGYGGPLDSGNLQQNPEETEFFRSDGSWYTPYCQFFLEWYSGMLLLHGERLCMATHAIFWGTGVKISAKVASINWHYGTQSQPSELTAGYYNTLTRDGYVPIARIFARYRMALCCTCFDMRDSEDKINPKSSPERFLRQLVHAARRFGLTLTGENSITRLDDSSLDQIVKSSRLYLREAYDASLSFTYVRMNKHLFESRNWNRFTRFVKRMSDARTFQARLDIRGYESCYSSSGAEALVCH